ncbi:post-transcriptional regulator [Aerococcus urinaehominis]|nr:post-transcriptional regulator [Aerococcus urinaehominis]
MLKPVFKSKAREFARQGYREISSDDIATYFLNFAWKRQVPEKLSQQVKAVRQLDANHYFDYERLQVTVYDVLPLDEIDISKLL